MTKKKTWKDWSSHPCLDCCVTFVLSLENVSLPWVQSGTVALNIVFFFKDDDLKKKRQCSVLPICIYLEEFAVSFHNLCRILIKSP